MGGHRSNHYINSNWKELNRASFRSTSREPPHVLGQTEGPSADLALVRLLLRVGQLVLHQIRLPGRLKS